MVKNGTILSNFDIENLCNQLRLPILGVFSKDRLSLIKQKIKGLFVVIVYLVTKA